MGGKKSDDCMKRTGEKKHPAKDLGKICIIPKRGLFFENDFCYALLFCASGSKNLGGSCLCDLRFNIHSQIRQPCRQYRKKFI